MTEHFIRHTSPRGTRLAVQLVPGDDSAPRLQVVLFDGRPMIDDGVPRAFVEAQRRGAVPALRAVYVESINGAAKRGKSRCASLTTAATLDRFATELRAYAEDLPTILVGHSLGAIAALHVATASSITNDVVLLSAALWWPGDDGQLSGERTIDAAAAAPLRVWMTVGTLDDRDLQQSNVTLAQRLSAAGRPPQVHSHPNGHPARPQDVVDGVSRLAASLHR